MVLRRDGSHEQAEPEQAHPGQRWISEVNRLAFIAEAVSDVLDLFVEEPDTFFEWLEGDDELMELFLDDVYE